MVDSKPSSTFIIIIIHSAVSSAGPIPAAGSITHHALDLGGQLALEDEALDVRREK